MEAATYGISRRQRWVSVCDVDFGSTGYRILRLQGADKIDIQGITTSQCGESIDYLRRWNSENYGIGYKLWMGCWSVQHEFLHPTSRTGGFLFNTSYTRSRRLNYPKTTWHSAQKETQPSAPPHQPLPTARQRKQSDLARAPAPCSAPRPSHQTLFASTPFPYTH